MKISTRGRYAIREMVDLAQHGDNDYTPLKDIAERQDISEKYLESITKVLVREGLLIGKRGKNGGYKLSRDPYAYTVWDVLSILEADDLAPVACLEPDSKKCPRADKCPTVSMWKEWGHLTEEYFSSITIGQLADLPQPFFEGAYI